MKQTAEITIHMNPNLEDAQDIFVLIKVIKEMASKGFYYCGDRRKTCRKIRNLDKQLLHALRGDK